MRLLAPFRMPGFAVLWSGLSLSVIGDQLFAVVFSWIAIKAFGGNAGYILALQSLTLFCATVAIGHWADTRDQRHCMIAADIARAVVLLFVVIMWSVADEPSPWLLIVALIGLGVGEAAFRPALQGVIPELIPEKPLLPAANGLLDATGRAARFIGPAMIGPLTTVLPIRHVLSVDAASFMLSALAVLSLGGLEAAGAARRAPRPRRKDSFLGGVARGFRATRCHPPLHYTLATYGLLNAAWNTVYYLALPMLIMSRDVKGPGDTGLGALGIIIAVYGASNLLSTLVFGARTLPHRPQWPIFGGSIVIGTGLLLLAPVGLLPDPWLLPAYVCVAAMTAIGGPMKDIPFAVLRQTCLAPEDIPAAMRAYLIIHSTGMFLGWMLMPALIAAIGATGVVILCGLATAGVGLIGMALYADWTAPA